MKLMEIVSGDGVNGAIVHCLLLTRELARRGHSVTVLCRPQSWIRRELRSDPVEVVESDLHIRPLDEVHRITAMVRAKRIELVHTHMTSAHIFGLHVRWMRGALSVATAHAHRRQWHWRLHDRIIAVSEATQRFHINHNMVSRNRIEVIHNFVDHRRFATVAPEARTQMRESFKIDGSWPVIGFVGSVFVEKGWLDLVRVFSKMSAAIPNARLLVVGDGPADYRSTLESEAARLGVSSRIIWAGRRFDIPEILSAMDLFVSPSHDEALPLTSLEAMAAGVAVVAAAVGGLPEVVCDGETGILVPPGDLDAMANAIAALLLDENRRKRLGEAGKRRAREHFSPDRQVPRLEQAFARTLAPS
jgi:glycosyltransferase involved in cell wall biosynthesis